MTTYSTLTLTLTHTHSLTRLQACPTAPRSHTHTHTFTHTSANAHCTHAHTNAHYTHTRAHFLSLTLSLWGSQLADFKDLNVMLRTKKYFSFSLPFVSARKEAWVTLATNDSYALGCLVLGYSLRRVQTTRQLVVMHTEGVSEAIK